MVRKFFLLILPALAAAALAACAPAVSQSRLITPASYVEQYSADVSFSEHILIDVRTPEEFAEGHIAGAVNIPVDQIGARLSEIPQDQTVVVYCRSGNRSATAAAELAASGYTVYDLGGIISWQAAGLPVTQ